MSGDASMFSDLNDSNQGNNRKPFFVAVREAGEGKEGDAMLLTWLKEEMNLLSQSNRERFEKIKDNMKRYKNLQYANQVYTPRDREEKRTKYMPQMVQPLIRDIVDEKTARLMQYKPSVAVMPLHDEQYDKADAKVAKRFLSHIDQKEKTDILFLECLRNAKIMGEYFTFVVWNPDLGPAMKELEIAKKNPEDGETYPERVTIGDLQAQKTSALDVLYEITKKFEDVNYTFKIDWEYTEALKLDYPEQASEIFEDSQAEYFDYDADKMVSLSGKTMKVTFFHRDYKYLPGGYEAVFTKDVILKRGKLPYEHGLIPWARFIDTTNPDECGAEPMIEYTRSMAAQTNNLNNMIIKQINLAANPKWMVDKNSVDDQALSNDVSIVKLLPGSRQPQLYQPNPVAPATIEFRKQMVEDFYKYNKSSSVVQGQPPPGVIAFVAIQFVSEQESQRMNQDVIYFGQSVKDFYNLCLKTCGQYYKKGEPRTMNILGKDNRWTIEQFDPAALQKDYALVIQNQTGLPESKAVRTQLVMDMGDKYPEMFPREQVVEMLGLSQSNKFFDEASSAAAAAEAENEKMLDGEKMIEPQEWENLIVHWRVHFQQMQDSGFKLQTSPKVQKTMIDHLMATEYLMQAQIVKSSGFAQAVATQCPQFPCILEIPTPIPLPPIDPMAEMPPPTDQGMTSLGPVETPTGAASQGNLMS